MRVEGQAKAGRPDISVLLKAPAGSGKTRALVGRLLHLLSAGVQPGDAAAITFTEKASTQMKERLFKSLTDPELSLLTVKEAFELEAEDTPWPLTSSFEAIFSKLIREPDALRVSTIHAFLLELLRVNPLEAGLPADFRVVPETNLLLRREDAVDETIQLLEAGELKQEYEALYRAGYDIKKLREIVSLSLEKRGQLLRAREGSSRLPDEVEKADSMLRAMIDSGKTQSFAREALGLIPEMFDAGTLSALRRLSELRDLNQIPEIYQGIKNLFIKSDDTPRAKSPLTKKDFTTAYGKAQETDKRNRWDEFYPGFQSSVSALACLYDSYISGRAKLAFLNLSARAEELYRNMCLRDGFIDFEDIELYALRLLASRPDIRLPRHLLVDEFQDTSQLQWDLLRKLAGEQFSGEGVEGPGASTFFAVGDINQSIYRFRKAEPRLMKGLKALMEERIPPGRRAFPELDINFRSAPQIIRFTDELFSPLLGEDYKEAGGSRDFHGSVRLKVAKDEAGALADEALGALNLDVEVDGALRKARFGDMAVLIQSRARLKGYEQALRERNIPFLVAGGTGFFQQDEVLAVLAVLKFLDNPADIFSLRMALTSLFGIPEGLIPPFSGPDALDEAAILDPRAAMLLGKWMAEAEITPLPELIDMILKSSSALLRFGRTRGAQAVFNLEKLSGLAREFCAEGDGTGGGLRDFVAWVRDYRRGEDLPSAGVRVGGEGADYLTVMTIHSAKGLEFPIVFLPGMGAYTRSDADRVLFGPPDEPVDRLPVDRPREKTPPFALWTDSLLEHNADYQALKDRDAVERERERIRLFYVAVTRARDHLVMLSDTPKSSRDTFLKMLLDRDARHQAPPPVCLFPEGFSAEQPEYAYPATVSVEPGNVIETAAAPAALPEMAPAMPPEAARAALAPLPARRELRFISPSSLADHELIKSSGAEGSVIVGTLVHEALASCIGTGGYALDLLPSVTGASRSEVREAEEILNKLFSRPAFKGLFSPGEGKYSELPLLCRRPEDAIIYGFADLVIIVDGRAKVIDVKTGISALPDDICVRAYRPQLQAYADAVREAFGVTEVEKYLLLAETGKLLSFT